jgi:hypothetical protein
MGTLWLVCAGPGGAGAEALEVHTAIGALRGAGHYQGIIAVADRRAFMRFGYGP